MTPLSLSQATGEDIEKIIMAMEPAIVGQPRVHVLMACIALALTIQNPDVTPEQLTDGVRGASEWIATYLSSLDPITANEVN